MEVPHDPVLVLRLGGRLLRGHRLDGIVIIKTMKTIEDLGPLPLEHLEEYDAAASYHAKHGRLPANMGSPGALDWIQADPEAFEEHVRRFKYMHAMNQTHVSFCEGSFIDYLEQNG